MQKYITPITRPIHYRFLNISALRHASWSTQPAPPRLPKEEQEIFEQLQKQSTGAFSSTHQEREELSQTTSHPEDTAVESPAATVDDTSAAVAGASASNAPPRQKRKKRTPPLHVNQSPHWEAEAQTHAATAETPDPQTDIPANQSFPQPTVRTGQGEELHPNIRRGAAPEFEGEVNPRTGETGGPKNEPLRWGHAGDWSYNGRVTDF